MSKSNSQTFFVIMATVFIAAALVITVTRAYEFKTAGSLSPSAAPASTMRSLLEMASKDSGDTFGRSTDSLEATRDRMDTVWTDNRAIYLDYLNTDLKYLVSTAAGSPASGSLASSANEILTDTADMQPKVGEITDYSGYYNEGTSVFSDLKDIRDALWGY